MPSSITSSDAGSDRIRVLLVDDNQAMLARAEAVLEVACAVVGEAHDGEAAIAAAAALRPDVIVLDISMPEMSGLEVAARLRLAGSTAEIVFLTVHDDAEFVEAAQAAGGIGYVVKARLASDLLQAVREAREHRPFVSLLH
jgi:DNA-binding NarL/FixJ family response regulator